MLKRMKIVGLVVVLSILTVLIVYIGLQFLPYNTYVDVNPWKKSNDHPLIIGDGGFLYPDNSMESFDYNVENDADLLQVDVSITKDQKLVAYKNIKLEKYTNSGGFIHDYDYAELLKTNFGLNFTNLSGEKPYIETNVSIVLLEDLFNKYPNQNYLLSISNDNVMTDELINTLITMIYELDLQKQVLVTSNNYYILDQFKTKTNGVIATTTNIKERDELIVASYSGSNMFYKPKSYGTILDTTFKYSGLEIPTTTDVLIWKINRHNMFVYYQNVNNKEEMQDLLNKEIDGIITSRIDLIREILVKED